MLEGLSCGERLSRGAFEEVKRRAVSEAFKWDITDNGSERLCDFPLLLARSSWRALAEWARLLSKEAEVAEEELLARPLLRSLVGVPLRLQRALRRTRRAPGLRYSRFDFHPTLEGRFVITEGNLDVASGWNDASGVTALFAEIVEGAEPAGDPAGALAESLARRLGPNGTVGIMHLTRYADDHQVARFLADAFVRRGLDAVFFDPTQLRSAGRKAGALVGDEVRPLDAVFRFFPAEWSCRLEHSREWFDAAAAPGTLWANPLSTVLTQSKRSPLTWRHLSADLPTWSALLPESRNPIFTPPSKWVLKPALGHEGYHVTIPGTTDAATLKSLWRSARLRPWRWVAQRRFRPMPLATPDGLRFPCVGVYVVDGEPVGLYGRLAERPLIDGDSQDVVVLVRP